MIAQYFDIIVLLVVVVIIYQRLKGLLGTRPEGTESRKISDEDADKIFDIIMKDAQKEIEAEKKQNSTGQKAPEEAVNLTEEEKIFRRIPGFDKETFLNGAKRAFEIILEAFNKGDTETLEMLVSKDLLKKFQAVIEQRRSEGITSETDFIGFDETEIQKAQITKNDIAAITVKFVSQQVNMLKNAEGRVIEGDEQYIQNITDVWTFEKALASTNPNWLLVSTKKQ